MKDFGIAKYLREHQMGSYGILNHYVDLKPLNEEIDLDSFKDFFNKNYSHIYHNFSDRDIKSFLIGKESLPLEKQADLFADYITSQELGDVVAEDATPTKGEYVVYYKTREMDKPKEYVRVKGKQKAETAWFNSHEFYKDDDKDYQWGYCPAEKWDAWVSKTVSEDVTPEESAEIPYEGPEHKLTGNGEGDEFEQAETVSEDAYGSDSEQGKFDRMMGLAHIDFEKVSPVVKMTIDSLRDDGFDDQDILDFLATDFTQNM